MLKLIHASKIYAKNGICALNAVDLTVQDGDYISVTGASGSGKSTLMHILGLLDSLTDGEYLLDGAAVAHLPAKQRARLRSEKIGFVFQQFRLLTGMTALENVALPLALQGVPRHERSERALAVLERVGLSDRANHRPHQLSGGQQQRVALARILCSQPEVILLDEPFSALDSYLKWDLELKLSDFLENFSGPILWVSHDRGEVFRNCKRVCILDQGASQGTFTLRQLFHEPETEAAARLSGCKNVMEAVPAGSAVTLPAWGLTLNCGKPVPADIRQAGIRARHVMTVPEGTPDAFYCTVERVIQDVFTTIVLLRPEGAAAGAPLLRMELERDDWRRLNRPEGLWIAVQPRDILLLK